MKKYFLMMLTLFSVCAVADPASARSRVQVVLSHHSYENVMVEEYPQYYVGHRVYRQPRHRCHHCRPRAHHRVHYYNYNAPVYYAPGYYYPVPQQEMVVYEQIYHWGW